MLGRRSVFNILNLALFSLQRLLLEISSRFRPICKGFTAQDRSGYSCILRNRVFALSRLRRPPWCLEAAFLDYAWVPSWHELFLWWTVALDRHSALECSTSMSLNHLLDYLQCYQCALMRNLQDLFWWCELSIHLVSELRNFVSNCFGAHFEDCVLSYLPFLHSSTVSFHFNYWTNAELATLHQEFR